MKLAIIVAVLLIELVACVMIGSVPLNHPKPVVVPHCFEPRQGWFLPCSDVDRYEYA